jgi:ribosomal protein S27AE
MATNTTYVKPGPQQPQQRPLKCPKCNSTDIVAGNSEHKNKCEKCGYTWFSDPDSKKDVVPVLTGDTKTGKQVDESLVIVLKSPEILLTLNQKPKTKFEKQLDEELSRLGD